ncbi:fimbrial protein [uncultured Pantoea sp.]|uniref:fimbrial protein n=1 Tax=uncultured Pantoea sp. TaxID=218084 RepID=UPI0025F2BE03|nr:fimbrial protein [uncultured Pantoea sp.]
MRYLKIVVLYHEKDKGKIRAVLSLVEFKLKIGFVIMNKKLLSLMTFAAISAASMGNASAADSGTLTFNGTVEESTCQITGLDQTVAIPEINAADVEGHIHNQAIHLLPVTFSASSCPAGISQGNITFSYTPQVGSDKDYLHLGDTDMRGVAVALNDGTYIKNGQTRTFVIDNNQGSYTTNVRVNRILRSGPPGTDGSIIPGNFAGNFAVTMTFQ